MSTLVGQVSGSLREAFGKSLVKVADPDKPNFLAVDVDLAGGTGLYHLRNSYPDRVIQCSIAEQAAVGISAGLAASTGLPIFLCGFAVFMSRAWEIFRLAVAHDKRNVKLVISHVGLGAGEDGSSCQSLESYAIWRSLANVSLIHPCDSNEIEQVIEWSLGYKQPLVILTGRNPTPSVTPPNYQFTFGKGSLVYPLIDHAQDLYPRTGDVTLIACGHTVAICIQAARQLRDMGLEVRVANLSTLKPVDTEFLIELQKTSDYLITCEDHNVFGGLYSIVAESLAPEGSGVPIIPIGVWDTFGESGNPDELYRKYGIGVDAVVKRVKELIR